MASGGGGSGEGCDFAGSRRAPGETFPAPDGCNTCTCSEDGSVGCTEVDCSAGGCEHEGRVYAVGERLPSEDACETCTCTESGIACGAAYCGVGCEHGGKTYAPGEAVPSGDECNSCVCTESGDVACTTAYCASGCVYGGKSHAEGESFPSLDGCNTCSCTEGGVACTEIACACEPEKEWWRSYASKDPEQCKVILYACPPSTIAFENACGCGCEQDESCPEYFDCMPPNTCDEAALKEKCPYSQFAY